MTPKLKAQELFDKMYFVEDIMGNYPMCFKTAKQCALIAVDEIINEVRCLDDDSQYYWEQVIEEIEAL